MKQELLILALSLETLRANSNGVWCLLWPFPFSWKGYGSKKLLLHCFQHKLFSNFLCFLPMCAKEEHMTYWSFCLKSCLVDFFGVGILYIHIYIWSVTYRYFFISQTIKNKLVYTHCSAVTPREDSKGGLEHQPHFFAGIITWLYSVAWLQHASKVICSINIIH